MPMTLRLATIDDWARLFAWRNDPDAVAASWSAAPVRCEEHMKWLRATIGDSSTALFVAYDSERGAFPSERLQPRRRYVGTGRLDLGKKAVTVSVTVDRRHRGCGYAVQIIDGLLEWLREDKRWTDRRIVAEIKPANLASLRAFAACGFIVARATDERIELERVL